MKNLIINMLKQNAEYQEFLEFKNNNNKDELKDHKHKNFRETETTDYLFVTIYDNSLSKTKNEITSIHFSKEDDDLFLSEIEIEKKINYNNDIFDVEYTFYLDELDSDFFSISIKIEIFGNEVFIEINESFESLNYSSRAGKQENDNFKKLRESFGIFSEIQNPEIVKAYLELFIFNKPISKEEKELFLISTDINLHDLEIIENFGYDFRQDMIESDKLVVNTSPKYKSIKFI